MEISNNYGFSPFNAMTNIQGKMQMPVMEPPEAREGELSGYLSETTRSEEVKDFTKSFIEMSKSGEFDAASLAAVAPESLQDYALEQGVELEDMLQSANDNFQQKKDSLPQGGNMPPGFGDGNMSGAGQSAMSMYSSIANSSGQGSLLSQLMSSLAVNEKA